MANDIPVQSDYLSLISLYFFLNLLFTFLSFLWFCLNETLKPKVFRAKPFFERFLKYKRLFKVKPIEIERKEEMNNHLYEFQIETSTANKLAFTLMVLIMLTSYLTIWILISQ